VFQLFLVSLVHLWLLATAMWRWCMCWCHPHTQCTWAVPLPPPPSHATYAPTPLVFCCQTDADATPWETLFPGVGPTSDVVVPAGRRVLLHGCHQPQSTVSVRTIRVEAGATVRDCLEGGERAGEEGRGEGGRMPQGWGEGCGKGGDDI
jgi:hypothetical protein